LVVVFTVTVDAPVIEPGLTPFIERIAYENAGVLEILPPDGEQFLATTLTWPEEVVLFHVIVTNVPPLKVDMLPF
jgi:hypothetical protein